MEQLDTLEKYIIDLLAQFDSLKVENTKLKESSKGFASLEQENHSLKAELEEEKKRCKTALDRVENIVESLKERSITE